MYPQLFKIPGLGWPINSYGFMIMVGFLLATYIGVRRGRELGIKSDLILDIGIISMIFGIVGAKINYVIQYPQNFGSGFRIFDFGDGGLDWRGALILGALPFAFWYWRTRKEEQVKLYSWQNGVLLVLTLFFALIGTRLLHLAPDWFRAPDKKQYDWSIFTSWQSGFVLYGGLVTAILIGALYTKMRGESVAKIADLSAPLVMIGLAFGRVGCFLNGCCYGKEWQGGFCAIRFPQGSTPYNEQLHAQPPKIDLGATSSLPVIPTQLLESAAAVGIFFGVSWYDRKVKKAPGESFLVMGLGYSVWRFIVEFLRDDPRPKWLGDLYYSQTMSLLVFITCAVWLFILRTRAPKAPSPEPSKLPEGKQPA